VNSFLLALTAVLIVVLSALFAAPLFIDWNDYRPVFETQASKLLGRDVKVGGKVHLVVLPAPELRFDDVKVADEKGSFEQPLLEARSISRATEAMEPTALRTGKKTSRMKDFLRSTRIWSPERTGQAATPLSGRVRSSTSCSVSPDGLVRKTLT